MIETKYIIILGMIAFTSALYYLYNELNNSNKRLFSTYRKVMVMENDIIDLKDKITTLTLTIKPKPKKDPESPMSMTYHSDLMNPDQGGKLSIANSDLSDDEIEEIHRKLKGARKEEKIEICNKSSESIESYNSRTGAKSDKIYDKEIDISDFESFAKNSSQKISPKTSLKISPQGIPVLSSPKMLKNRLSQEKNYLQKQNYDQMLKDLSTDSINDISSDTASGIFDMSIAKKISDSVNVLEGSSSSSKTTDTVVSQKKMRS
jgi:hypothetical protein